jgi:hypothetical protein
MSTIVFTLAVTGPAWIAMEIVWRRYKKAETRKMENRIMSL